MNEYLPLGSIVLLKGGLQKVIIIGRAITVNNQGQTVYFDYGGVPYPDGLTGDQMAYFNGDQIGTVVFEGYRDVEDEHIIENIKAYKEAHPEIKKADPKAWQV